jgi:ABC-2 type transport system permease protein
MTTQSKTLLTHDEILAARKGLLPVSERTWFGGFGNMLSKELGQWWGTNLWWIQTLIWVFIINGITTMMMLTDETPPAEMLQELVLTYFPLSAMVVGIGTIATVQGAIVGEKELGTAAWIMSKPASRSAFILSKAVAYAVGFWITGILIPSTIFVIETRLLVPATFPLQPFLVGVVLLALSQLFYLILTLMLGTLLNNRGAIIGVGIAIALSGQLLKGMVPMAVLVLTPWLLPDIGSYLTLDLALPPNYVVPILTTSAWIVVMTVVALLRFNREDF